MTDGELLGEFAGGDQKAFAELVRRHADWVWGSALRQAGDGALAEDRPVGSLWPGECPAEIRLPLDQRLVVRPANWAAGVDLSISRVERDRLHVSVNRGRPYDSDRWTQASGGGGRLGLQSSLRNPGRPRKISHKDGMRT